MPYNHDMSEEKEPKIKKLLPEGWRKFRIIDCKEKKSKAGNMMFVFTFLDIATQYEDEVYAVAEKGKRWFLKNILAACNAPKDDKGHYKWDIPDVLDKEIDGFIEHEENNYYNRDGEYIEGKQHRITKLKPSKLETDTTTIPQDEIAWDEDKR